jgi:hypothetical protein
VPRDDLPEHEGDVDPEREADDVEDDEGYDRPDASQRGDDRPTREQVEARGSDVAIGSGRLRRLPRHLGRRDQLAGHVVEA